MTPSLLARAEIPNLILRPPSDLTTLPDSITVAAVADSTWILETGSRASAGRL